MPLTQPLSRFVKRALVSCAPDATVTEAVAAMARADTASIVVLDAERAVGILTDSDLRRRVVAAGRDGATRVREVMSAPVITLHEDQPALDAMQAMLDREIHHIVIVDADGRAIGVVADSDLLAAEAAEPLLVARRIARATDVAELRAAYAAFPAHARALFDRGVPPDALTEILSSNVERIVLRAHELALASLGAPPAPYAWIVMGSHGRRETTLVTDQDDALVWSDEAGAEHEAYFGALAEQVVSSLERIGLPRCHGGVVASNAEWRGPLSRWRERLGSWLERPEPDAVLRGIIAFDLRPAAGDPALVEELRSWLLERTPNARRFHAHLARAALERRPPLDVLGRVGVERRGPLAGTFDAKRRAVDPVVQGARVLALEAGLPPLRTPDRLAAAAERGLLPQGDARDLRAAFLSVQRMRIGRQLAQIAAGREPDNAVRVAALPAPERAELREALHDIARFLDGIAQRYAMALRALG